MAACMGATVFAASSFFPAITTLFLAGGRSLTPRPSCKHRGSSQRSSFLATRCSGADEADPMSTAVRWLAPLQSDLHGPTLDEPPADVTILPLFPLQAYLPGNNATLTIFEPRYRALYDDILFSGSRRFVMTAVDQETGRFAEYGVVFYLDDLQDVSARTEDKYKYVCSHRVIGRVRLGRIVNPSSWWDRSTYLNVHTTPVLDSDDGLDFSQLEDEAMATFKSICELQEQVDEQVRFNGSLADQFDARREGRGGLWSLMNVWLEFFSYQAQNRQKNLEKDIESRTKTYMEANPDTPFDQVLDIFRAEMQKRFNEEVATLLQHRSRVAQLLLQSASHEERLQMVQAEFSHEQARLRALKAVKAAVADVR